MWFDRPHIPNCIETDIKIYVMVWDRYFRYKKADRQEDYSIFQCGVRQGIWRSLVKKNVIFDRLGESPESQVFTT